MGLNFRENPEELYQGTSSFIIQKKIKNIFIKYVHTTNIDFFFYLFYVCLKINKIETVKKKSSQT